MLIRVAADGIDGSDITTITYVFDVKMSMKAAKLEFLTSMLWKEAASLLWERREKSKEHKIIPRNSYLSG